MGHRLEPVAALDGESCDLCGKKQQDDTVLRCKQCKYFLCKKCVEWGTNLFKADGSKMAIGDQAGEMMAKPVGVSTDGGAGAGGGNAPTPAPQGKNPVKKERIK